MSRNVSRQEAVHFGALLVIQLAALKNSFSGLSAQTSQSSLADAISKICRLGPGAKAKELCHSADEFLGDLVDAIEGSVPTRARDLLSPIYAHRNEYRWGRNSAVIGLLELLCDEESVPFETARFRSHDIRMVCSSLGGWLVRLADWEMSRKGDGKPSFAEAAGLTQRICLRIGEVLQPARNTVKADDVITGSYLGTEEHKEAEKLLIARLEWVAASKPDEEEWIREMLSSHVRAFGGEPHVTPLIELLTSAADDDAPFELLNDPVVLRLRSECATI